MYGVLTLKLTLILLKFQCFYTRKLFYLCNFAPTNYDAQLKCFGLQSLELRRVIRDLCFVFKLTQGLKGCILHQAIGYALNVSTIGHLYKLYVAHARKLILSTHFMHYIVFLRNFYLN